MPIPDLSQSRLADLLLLTDRRALVTGGGRGIGAAVAARLAEAGADVVVADRDLPAAREAAMAASVWGHRVAAIPVELTDGDSIRQMVQTTGETLGGIDILVNNAGVYPITPLHDLTDEAWDTVLSVNLRSVLIASREVSAAMIEGRRGGVIISTSSTAGFRAGGPGKAHYVATKHGLRGLTKALAIELGPHNIRVLDVAPTLTATPGIEDVLDPTGSGEARDRLDRTGSQLPLGRAAQPDDIARVIAFCASDLAIMMTGVTVPVDGGHLAR